jgi:hypothetical protein
MAAVRRTESEGPDPTEQAPEVAFLMRESPAISEPRPAAMLRLVRLVCVSPEALDLVQERGHAFREDARAFLEFSESLLNPQGETDGEFENLVSAKARHFAERAELLERQRKNSTL